MHMPDLVALYTAGGRVRPEDLFTVIGNAPVQVTVAGVFGRGCLRSPRLAHNAKVEWIWDKMFTSEEGSKIQAANGERRQT